MNYSLSKSGINNMITQCQLAIEAKYKGHIDDDNYFKRGFLLACQEMTAAVIDSLEDYEVVRKDGT